MKALSLKAKLVIILLISNNASCLAQSVDNNSIGDIIDNKGIITQGQKGDNIIINKEETPKIEYYGRTMRQISNGKFSFLWKIMVTKPVSRLFLQAHGANVDGIKVYRDGHTTSLYDVEYTSSTMTNGMRLCEASFSNGLGVYLVDIITNSDVPPHIASKFE